ncbi:MAG: hypothetical protein HY816_04010 [Candidatus Wallbacteria bacterium]|nr:hypothetical protein [Candidatus Wallbacteria bacterium]
MHHKTLLSISLLLLLSLPANVRGASLQTLAGTGSVNPGLQYFYSVTFFADSTGHSLATITNPIPVSVTYVPGSMKLYRGDETVAISDAGMDADGDFNVTTPGAVVAKIANLQPSEQVSIEFTVKAADNLPAGSSVKNKASVTYDFDGDSSTIFSNEDSRNVNFVQGIELTPDSAASSGLPGAVVDYPVTVTNTSNFTVSIGLAATGLPVNWSAKLYEDSNQNGLRDVGETTEVSGFSQVSAFTSRSLVAAVSIPLTAVGGESGSITITANIPTEKAKEGSSPANVKGKGLVSAAYTTTVLGGRAVELAPAMGSKFALPGALADYAVTITNTGNDPDQFNLTATGLPQGWSATVFRDTDGDGIKDDAETTQLTSTGNLNSDEALHVIVRVSVPSDALAFAQGTVVLTAEGVEQNSQLNKGTVARSNSGLPTASGSYQTTVSQKHAATLTPASGALDRLPGLTADYAVTITNTGNGADTFALSTSGLPTTWTVEVYSDADGEGDVDMMVDTVASSTGSLDPADSFHAVVRVTVAAGAQAGDVGVVTLTATPSLVDNKAPRGKRQPAANGEPEGTVSGNYTTLALQKYAITLTPATGSKFVRPAQVADYPARITNTGNGPDTISLTTSGLPQGWTANLVKDENGNGFRDTEDTQVLTNTGSLGANLGFPVIVSVTAPQGTAAGTVGEITLTASSSQNTDKRAPQFGAIPTTTATGKYTTTILSQVAVELTPATASFARLPGFSADYPATITNTGNITTTFLLSLSGAPTTWTASLLADQNGDGIAGMEDQATSSTGTLGVGQATHVIVRVDVPASAAANDVASVTLTASPDDAKQKRAPTRDQEPISASGVYTTTVLQRVGVELTPETALSSKLPGATADYPATITNTGNGDDVFKLSVSGLPGGWSAEIVRDVNGNAIRDSEDVSPTNSTGLLSAGHSYDVVVRVTVPTTATAGSSGEATLSAVSQVENETKASTKAPDKSTGTATGIYTTFVLRTPAVALTPASGTASRLPGDVADYAATITNTGNGPDVMSLSANGLPTTWTGSIYFDASGDGTLGNDETTEVTQTSLLGAGEAYKAIVRVAVPAGALAGDVGDVTLTATAGADLDLKRAPFGLAPKKPTAVGAYRTIALQGFAVELTPPTDAQSRLPGAVADYPATITNSGNGFDSISLQTSGLPTTWTAKILEDLDQSGTLELSETSVVSGASNLAPGHSYSVVVRVQVPTGAQAGDVGEVTLTAQSVGASTKTIVRPSVKADTSASGVYKTTVLQQHGVALAPATATLRVNPGATADYPATITNTGNGPDTFSLATAGLPTTWTASVVQDTNANGQVDTGESTVASSTGQLAAGGSTRVIVRVTVPADALYSDAADITLTASEALPGLLKGGELAYGAVPQAKASGVYRTRVAFKQAVVLTPATAALSRLAGTVADYPATITNTTNGEDGFSVALSGLPTTWTASIFEDQNRNGTLDSAETTIVSNSGLLSRNASIAVIVRVSVPEAATAGDVGVVTLTARPLAKAKAGSAVALAPLASATGVYTTTVLPPLNRPPVASIQTTTPLTGSPRILNLDGSKSTDPDEDALTYSWTLTTRPDGAAPFTSTLAVTQYNATVVGAYMFTLTVRDPEGLTDTASIAFLASVRPPIAIARGDQQLILPRAGIPATIPTTLSARLDGTASFHPDKLEITYKWTVLRAPDKSQASMTTSTLVTFDDATASRPVVTFLGTTTGGPSAPLRAAGPYRFLLTVSDGVRTATDTVDIDVLDPSTFLPNADPGLDRAFTVERAPGGGLNVTIPDPTLPADQRSPFVRLDGRESADSLGRKLTYRWTVTRVPPFSTLQTLEGSTTPFPFFRPDQEGIYEFELTVNNGIYDSVPNRVRIVISASNHAPTALAFVRDPVNGRRSFAARPVLDFQTGAQVELNGSLSTDPDAADRGALTYAWSQLSGPPVTLAPSVNAVTVTFTADRPGLTEFQLTVTDISGTFDEARVGVFAREAADNSRLSIVSSATLTNTTGEGFTDQFPLTPPRSLRVTIPTTVTLTGKVTGTFPAGQRFDHLWTQVEGPVVLLTAPSLLNTTSLTSAVQFAPTTSRVHLFDLTVFPLDATGNRTSAFLRQFVRVVVDTNEFSVPEAAGIVTPAIIPLTGSSSQRTITLDGSQSKVVKASAARGLTLFYSWRQVDGPRGEFVNPYQVITTFVAPEFSEDATTRDYLFELTVDVTPPGDRSQPLYFQVVQQGAAAAAGPLGGCNCGIGGGCAMSDSAAGGTNPDLVMLLLAALGAIALRASQWRRARALALAAAAALALAVSQAQAAKPAPFSDVPRDHWAHGAVDRAREAGLLDSRARRFDGAARATRYQMAVIVARMLDRVDSMPPGKVGEKDLENLEALTIEFADELALLNVKTSALEQGLGTLKGDVAGLEKARSSGGIGAGIHGLVQARMVMANAESSASALFRGRTLPVSRYPGAPDATGINNGRTFFDIAQSSVAFDRTFDENFKLHLQLDFDASNEATFITANNVQINEAFVDLVGWLGDGDVTVRAGAWALPFGRERDPELTLDPARRLGFRTLDLTITPTLWDQTWERVRNVGVGLASGEGTSFKWQAGLAGASAVSSVENGSLLLTRQFAQASMIGAGPNLLAILAGDPPAQAAAARFAAGAASFGNRPFGVASLTNPNLYGDVLSGVDVNGGPVQQDGYGFYGWIGDTNASGFRWDLGYFDSGGNVSPAADEIGSLNEWRGAQLNIGYWGLKDWGLMGSYFRSNSSVGAGLPEVESRSWSALVNRKLGANDNLTLRYEDAEDALSRVRFEAQTWTFGWNHRLGESSLLQLEYSAPDTIFRAPGVPSPGDACDEQIQLNYKLGF